MKKETLHAPGHWPGHAERALCNHTLTGPFATTADEVTCGNCKQWPAAVAAVFAPKLPPKKRVRR